MVIEGWLAPLTEARFVRIGDLSCDDYMIDKVTSLAEFDEQSGRPLYKDLLTGIVFTMPNGIDCDGTDYIVQEIVRRKFYEQNPTEMTKRVEHEMDLIAMMKSMGRPFKRSERAAASATKAGRRPEINELKIHEESSAGVQDKDQRGDQRDVCAVESQQERGSTGQEARAMAESQVLHAWSLTELPGPKHPGKKLFEDHVKQVMHSIMKSRKLRRARRARRAMKGAKKRGDPEGIPSSLAEKIDNFAEDWSDDQQR